MASKLSIRIGQYTDAGNKSTNKDSHGYKIPSAELCRTKGIAAIIADGVGGNEYAKQASEACVIGFLADYFSTAETWTVKKSALQVLTTLNSWLYNQGRSESDPHRGKLSTLSALVLKSTTAHLIHIGDSRIYRLRNNQLKQLTADHKTWVSKDKSYLSRAMGADIHIDIDYSKHSIEAGDIFLLTTDGVHEYVSDVDMGYVLHMQRNNLERAAGLIALKALESNSPDNVTCQALSVDELPDQDPDEVYRELTELPFPPELNEGMIIDGYRVVRELHASNRSQLYVVRDVDTGFQFVMKTPSVNYEDDPAYIERFKLEEWVGKRVDNPHVVKVYEPQRRRRFLYLITEYVQGVTLRQWMHDHPQPDLTEVRGLVDQIVKGLQALHRLEMLHQDLKPENIMIDVVGTIKLVDFGSIKVAGIAEIATPIERVNLLGTKNYTAPEYAHNQPGTNASDIYSLGVITYQLLTGYLPYGEMPGNWKNKDVAKRLYYTPAVRYVSNLPLWVDEFLKKATHYNPAKRYSELSEFLFDFRNPSPNLTYPERVPIIERNPLKFWQGLSLFLTMLCGYLVYLIYTSSR